MTNTAMNAMANGPDHQVSEEAHKHTTHTVFGFWIFIMTDCILFSALFAAFAVGHAQYAGGPSGKQLFDLSTTAIETAALLFSSVTCGFMMLAAHKRLMNQFLFWAVVTIIFGLVFVGLEVSEFYEFVADGHGPNRSAFLSSFFSLVATHGIHVTSGMIWLTVLLLQIKGMKKGLTEGYLTRLMCFSLFWHFLDIIWICLFTFVYLMGAL